MVGWLAGWFFGGTLFVCLGFFVLLFKGFYLFTCIFSCISLRELFMSFLKSPIRIMRCDFKSTSCFSGELGYPRFAMVGDLGSDDAKKS